MNRDRRLGGGNGTRVFRWLAVCVVGVGASALFAAGCSGTDKDASPPEHVGVSSNPIVVQVPPNGGVTTIAGKAGSPGNVDAPVATDGRLNDPAGVAVASDGTIYVADWINNSIRRIKPDGSLDSFAKGTPNLLPNPRFEEPTTGNETPPGWHVPTGGSWRAIDASTVAGAGNAFDGSRWAYGQGYLSYNLRLAPDAVASGQVHARFSVMARDYASVQAQVKITFYNGNFTAAPTFNGGSIAPSSNLTWHPITNDTLLPTSTTRIFVSLRSASGNVAFDAAQLHLIDMSQPIANDQQLTGPTAIGVDPNNVVYIASADGVTRTFDGTTFSKVGANAGYVSPVSPMAIAVASNSILVAESGNTKIHVQNGSGIQFYADVGGAANAEPVALAAVRNATAGNYWVAVAYRGSSVIRGWLCPEGSVNGSTVTCTVLGQFGSTPGYADDLDGTVGGERFGLINALGAGRANQFGEIFVAEENNNVIRRANNPFILTAAGSTIRGFQDGASNIAQFSSPSSVAVAPNGDVIVADRLNHTIRRILCAGTNVCAPSRDSCAKTPMDDGNVCTTDTCAVVAIKHDPNTVSCTDGNACTSADTCSAGSCVPGPAVSTDDHDPCTIDGTCDAATGTAPHTPITFTDNNLLDCLVPICSGSGSAIYVNAPEGTGCGTTQVCSNNGVCEPAAPPAAAPILPISGATSFGDSTKFIFEGTGKVQTGVAPGTIDLAHAGWLVGYVKTTAGNPMSNVVVTVVDQPKFGQTTTRADGRFDMIVNGGAYYTLRFSKLGHFASDRRTYVGWEETSALQDVILLTPDATKSTSLSSGSQSQQVAIGSTSNDGGTRTPVVVVPANTSVYVDGAAQSLASMTMRITEYTIGPDGMKRMPAPLAAATGYTYAAEISLDEAMAAKKVDFKDANGNPMDVYFYLENFLGFSVGNNVPSGFYDRDKATWVAGKSGRVIKIIKTGSANGIDVTGDGIVDNVTADATLGFTSSEVTTLLARYADGQTLWRVPMNHLTPWDLNWPVEPPVCEGNECPPPANPPVPLPPPPPPLPPPPPPPPPPPDCRGGSPSPGSASADDLKSGSIVRCDSQAVDEEVPVPGTPYKLHYSSGRAPGYTAARQFKIDATGAVVHSQLSQVDVTIAVAGQRFEKTFLPVAPAAVLAPNLSWTFVWDGKDVFGRPVIGAARATAVLTNYYKAKYAPVALFGGYPDPAAARIANPRAFVALSGRASAMLTARSPDKGWALGGWTLNRHHFYSPASGTLFYGSGGARSIATDLPPFQTKAWQTARFDEFPMTAEGAPNGDVFVLLTGGGGLPIRIVRVGASGSITRVVGGNSTRPSCLQPPNQFPVPNDGPNANDANLSEGQALAVGPDGSLYIGDGAALRRATPNADGTTFSISTIAGRNCADSGYTGDGGPATAAKLSSANDVAVGPDGTVYVADGCRIRHIDKSGNIATVAGRLNAAGSPSCGGSRANEGKSAASVDFPVMGGLAVGPDGSLYVQSFNSPYDLMRVDPNGTLRFLTGTATVPVTEGQLLISRALGIPLGAVGPAGVVVRSDNSLVFVDDDNYVTNRTTNHRTYVRTADAAGVVRSLAATADTSDGTSSSRPMVGVALANGPYFPTSLGTLPNGDVLVANALKTVYRISTNKTIQSTKCPAGTSYQIPGGEEAYCFEASGRHLSTVSARTGQPLLTFGYTNGLLTSVTDDANRVTTVTAASPSRYDLVAPGRQTTTIGLDANGWASSIGDKLGSITLTTRADGLLDDLKDRKQALFDFDYETDGRLKSDANPRGTQTLSRELLSNGRRITHKTPLGRTTTFEFTIDSSKRMRHTTTLPDLSQVIKESFPDGIERLTMADGTVFTDALALDPTFGDGTVVSAVKTTKLPSGLSATIQQQLGTPVAITGGMSQVNRTLFGAAAAAPFAQTTLSYSTSATALPGIGAAQKVYLDSPLHRQTTILLDSLGNPQKVQVGALTPVTLAYETTAASEDFGKIKIVTQGLRRRTLEYQSKGAGTAPDDAGYLLRVSGPYSKQKYVRDLHGRVTTAVEAEGVAALAGTTMVGWDLNGRLESVKVPSAKAIPPEHKFGYDVTRLLESYTAPTVSGVFDAKTTFSPDDDLQLTTEMRPKELSTSTPVTVTRAYVAGTGVPGAGKLDTVKFLANGSLYPAGIVDYDYFNVTNTGGSAAGRVTALRGPYGVNLAYLYDGYLTTKVTWSGDVIGSVSWAFDANLAIKSEAVAPSPAAPAPSVYTFGYDNDRLLTCVSSATGTPCNPSTSADLVLTRSAEHGLVTGIAIGATIPVFEQIEYSDSAPDDDGATDTDGVDARFGELRRQRLNVNGAQVANIAYDAPTERRDDEGRIRFKTETFGSIVTDLEYQYDERGRLHFVQTGVATELFGYDLNGNRTSYTPQVGAALTGVYDDQDRLLSYGTASAIAVGDLKFTYGPNGELSTKTVKTAGSSDVWTFGHDPLGSLVTVAKPGGTLYTYLVDGRGRRVGRKKKVGAAAETVEKRWLYRDALNPVAELDGNGATVARYVYASRANIPDLVIKGNAVYRLFADQLGSPRMAVNVANPNDVPYRVDYSAFGVPRWRGTGAAASPAFDWIPFGFAGGLYDSDTELIRFGARDYDPSIGRWVSKDPILFGGRQANLYVYAGNDPINRADPLGLEDGAGGMSGFGNGGAEGVPGSSPSDPEPIACGNEFANCVSDCMEAQGAAYAADAFVGLTPFAPTPKTAWELGRTMGGGASMTTWASRVSAGLGMPASNALRGAGAVAAKASFVPYALAGGYWTGSAAVCAAECG